MRRLIYIMGCAHCGSTLLTTLLGRHSQIATVGELKMTAIPDLNDYLCGCGEQLLKCEFWKKVGAACRDGCGELDFNALGTHYWADGWFLGRAVGTGVRGPFLESLRRLALCTWSHAASTFLEITRRNKVVMDAVCKISGKPVFLDGSKDPVRLLHFSRSGDFDVRGIHLLRDGRAIFASHKKRNPDMNANLQDWRGKTLECERAKRAIPPEQVLTLRYEDLCQDPLAVLSRIFAFAGLDDESSSCLVPGDADSRHIIGHNSRLGNHREIRLKRDWQQLLTTDDLALFEKSDRGLNARHGYVGELRDRHQPVILTNKS